MPIAPPAPSEVAVPKEAPTIDKIVQRFKDAKDGDALSKPAKPPEKPTAVAAPAAPPKPAPLKIDEGSVVPKLEPLEKKAEAPPAPAPKVEGEPVPEKLSHKNFKEVLAQRDEVKAKYEAAEKRAKELEAKLQEQSTRVPPELEETKKLLAEKDHFINQFYLEQSPEFQRAFTQPIEQAIQDAKDVIGGEKGEQLAEVLRAPDGKWRTEQIKAIVGELSDEYERGTVRDAVASLRKLERARKDELEKAGTNVAALKQLHQKRQEESAAQQKEAQERLVNYALEAAVKTLPEFQESDDPANNLAVAENKNMLKSFLGKNLPPEDMATIAVWAVHGIRSKDMVKALNEKVAMLEGEIAKLSGASPDLDAGGSSTERTDKADTPDKAGARFMRVLQSGVPQK